MLCTLRCKINTFEHVSIVDSSEERDAGVVTQRHHMLHMMIYLAANMLTTCEHMAQQFMTSGVV